jgi:hypothetical protein
MCGWIGNLGQFFGEGKWGGGVGDIPISPHGNTKITGKQKILNFPVGCTIIHAVCGRGSGRFFLAVRFTCINIFPLSVKGNVISFSNRKAGIRQ